MSSEDRQYWRSPAERETRDEAHRDEFPAGFWEHAAPSRRAFLKAAGFTFAGTWAAACQRAPVEQAIPSLIKPTEITPGRAYAYASTCAGCAAGCGMLVTTRDGRPIKLEGNPDHPLSRGALCAAGQASILGLYDSRRLTSALRGGAPAAWADIDRDLTARFDEIRQARGAVRLLTGTITSPTLRAEMGRFLSSFADGRHVTYDPLSCSAILDAHEATHGVRALPRLHLDRAQVIVGVEADFLATWFSPVEHARAWADGRRIGPDRTSMSYHVQLESRMSVTGSKADARLRVAPWEIGPVLRHLAASIAARADVAFTRDATDQPPVPVEVLEGLAARLWEARGRSLVVCGTQNADEQLLCVFINELLGNYGTTIDLRWPSYQRQGSDAALEALRREIVDGHVAALLVAGVNPLYDLPDAATFGAALSKVPLVVSLAERVDETAAAAHYVCPDHHYLESWRDAEAVAGVISLTQPAIQPIGGTRSALETFASWNGRGSTPLEILRAHWREAIFPRASTAESFDAFWDRSLERGVVEIAAAPLEPVPFDRASVRPATQAATPPAPGQFALLLHPTVAMLDGRHAYNAFLHELPDPISKVTWDNYASFSPAAAAALGVSQGDIVRLATRDRNDERSLELPAFIQPGQHDRVVAVALGYGCKGTDRFANVGPQWLEARPTGNGDDSLVGRNAAPLLRLSNGRLHYTGVVDIVKTGRHRALASTQDHHTLRPPEKLASSGDRPRPIVQELTLADLLAHPAAEDEEPADAAETRGHELWPADHPYTGYRWALAIDLSACTGCSACVTACQVENNVPVVGQDEVRRHREMHWIRLDRYYTGDEGEVDVVHQPMLCQHCENAPCETVCPVLATVHSAEGLNEQVYNRCVGTRYCANNCPYKVRRFNWFNYPREDRLQNLVLNPDVTVRSRGVMEKCSLCVQRIQEARIEARRQNRRIADGDIQTACQQTCPAQAIVFGDVNDPKSRISALVNGPRTFRVLEELNVRPSVRYLKVVRNRPRPSDGPHA